MAFNFGSFLQGMSNGGVSGYDPNWQGLKALLPQAQAAVQADPQAAQQISEVAQAALPPIQGEDITVTGAPKTPTAESQLNIEQPPLEALRATPEQLQRMAPLEGLPQHKGMFGVKGTLRDILGVLGDAFLVQSGNKAVYAPQRQQERMSDALVGMGPGKERDAIARAMALDPDAGMKLYQDWQERMHKAAQLEAQEKKYVSEERLKRAKLQNDKIKHGQIWAANTKDPAVHQQIKDWIKDPEATLDDIPDSVLAASAMNPYQRDMMDFRRERMAQQDKWEGIKESGRNRRDNPPPRARADTDQEKFFQIGNIPENKRTQVQKDFYTKYRDGTGKGRRPPPGKGGATKPKSSGGGWGKARVISK